MTEVKILRIVVASPSDVQAERDALSDVVSELNRGVAADRDLRVELSRWETDTHPGFHTEGPQGLIDPLLGIEDCDILIGIFWKRFGTPAKDAQSGTEHEFHCAYEAWRQKGQPQIMVYFNQEPYAPKSKDEVDQWSRVLEFKENFPQEGLWWEYQGTSQFERLVRNHLTQFIRSQGRRDQVPPPERALVEPAYDFTHPVSDPRMFKGRQKERDEILRGVRQGKSYAIVGGTRSGKTSLLFELKRFLLEELEKDTGCVVGPVFLNTQQFPKLSQIAIYRTIVDEFKTVCRKRLPELTDQLQVLQQKLFDPEIIEDEAFPSFVGVLESIVRAVSDLKIVVMIDEVDELQLCEWSRLFFNNLRHLVSIHHLGTNKNVTVIISGTLAIYSLYKVAGSPFLNVIAGTKTLKLLSPVESAELINEPTRNQLDQAVVEYIHQQTGGHPFLIQYLMHHLCEQFTADLKSIRQPDVDEVVEKFLDERSDFKNWVSDFTAAHKEVYGLIAGKDGGAEKLEIIRTVGDADQANTALDLLTHIGVIREPQKNTYVIGGQMFKKWFQDNVASFNPRAGVTDST